MRPFDKNNGKTDKCNKIIENRVGNVKGSRQYNFPDLWGTGSIERPRVQTTFPKITRLWVLDEQNPMLRRPWEEMFKSVSEAGSNEKF